MKKTLFLPLLACLYSCLSPDEISILADPEVIAIDHLLASAIVNKEGARLKKLVKLDGELESIELKYDTLIIRKDLKPLLEYSFSRLITSTNYNKTNEGNDILFERKEKEKKGPISVSIGKDSKGAINFLRVNFEDENYLYKSDQVVNVNFEKEKLMSYKIIGNRKLIGLDPSNYIIEVSVENP